MTIALGLSSITLYMAATLLLGMRLISSDYSVGPVKAGVLGTTLVAVCTHGALLYHGVVTEAGLNLGFFNAASLVAWVIALFLVAAATTKPVDNLGVFVLPLAAVAVFLTLLYPSERLLSDTAGLGVQIHVVISILAYSVLTVAAFQAMVLAFQEHRLRRRPAGNVMRILPPLQTQESLMFQMIGLGFFLLSLSLVSGIMFLDNMLAQHLAHKTVLSFIAWAVFAVLLWGRWRYGWRGRTAIKWSLSGFVILMLGYFGSKLVLEVILDRAWRA